MDNNIRTMEYKGEDSWSRPVYQCIETGVLYKDITLGSETPYLCSCNNDFDGEPDCPIRSDLKIYFIEREDEPSEQEKLNYMLLGRLQQDCEYYLGYGNKQPSHLWAKNEEGQIDKMKELYNSFSDDEKPEWLPYEQILEYENKMVYHF